LSVEGQGLAALQRKLKTFPDGKVLTREMNKALRKKAQPMIPHVRDAAREGLPRAGGLNEIVAALPMKVVVSSSRNPGVKIVVKGTEAQATNKGRLRHPVFVKKGQRDRVWVTQQIPPGWFSNKMKVEAPKVRPGLQDVLEDIARKVARA
jgi:hypothetical protein